MLLAACSGGGGGSTTKPATVPTDPASVSGDITVLTNRTDLVQDGTFKKYAAEFEKIYPKVKVTFQGITDYEGEVKIRMNTTKYGDVLDIPNALSIDQYPQFFSPLGKESELSKQYRYTPQASYQGTTYGIAQNGNVNGVVYNKTIWKQAGITDWPKTPDEFVADLQAIKSKTAAIPYYTNYHDGWPVQNFGTSNVGSLTCDADAYDKLAKDKAPWADGKELNTINSMLYTMVQDKLTEPDPTTTNWEKSKALIATGKISSMLLGSWAVSQMQGAAKTAGTNPDDIGFMPFPAQVNGKYCAISGPDYHVGINKNSKYQAADRAWIDWFVNKSGYAQTQGDVPTPIKGAMPSFLADFQKQDVTFLETTPDSTGAVSKVDKASEIGVTTGPEPEQKLIDIARGAASGDKSSYFAQLNKEWAQGIQTAGE